MSGDGDWKSSRRRGQGVTGGDGEAGLGHYKPFDSYFGHDWVLNRSMTWS